MHAFSNDSVRPEVPRGVLQHLVGEVNEKPRITMHVIGFRENQGHGKNEILGAHNYLSLGGCAAKTSFGIGVGLRMNPDPDTESKL